MSTPTTLRTCLICGDDFTPNRNNPGTFCSNACLRAANRKAFYRHETAAILPSEKRPIRTSKMTDEEMEEQLTIERAKLDAKPRHPTDDHWCREEAGQ